MKSTYTILANGVEVAKSQYLDLAILGATAYMLRLDPDTTEFPRLTLITSDDSGVSEREIEL
jgi:hypothetical protein